MRDAKVYCFRRALPRMSWSPHNLYNLWCRSLGAKQNTVASTPWNPMTLFQQRWRSKVLLRAYHGDYINENIFKRWYLPENLPDVRAQSTRSNGYLASLNKWAKRDEVAAKEEKRIQENEQKSLAPVGSLMFREVERRIDVLVFRSCFAHSVYEARRLVIHGDVMLNGKKHTNPNTRLAPGDMISVNPAAIRFLQASAAPKQKRVETSETSETDEAAAEAFADAESSPDTHTDRSEESPAAADSAVQPVSAFTSEPKAQAADKWGSKKENSNLTPFHLPRYASPFIFIPAYIEPSFSTCSAIYVRHPTAVPDYSEIPTPYDADGDVVRFAWEWYSKRRTRMRSKTQLARMPENRKALNEIASV